MQNEEQRLPTALRSLDVRWSEREGWTVYGKGLGIIEIPHFTIFEPGMREFVEMFGSYTEGISDRGGIRIIGIVTPDEGFEDEQGPEWEIARGVIYEDRWEWLSISGNVLHNRALANIDAQVAWCLTAMRMFGAPVELR